MILFIQLLLQVVSIPLFLFLSGSFIEQDSRPYFVQLMRLNRTIFYSGTESALDKLWTSTGTSTGALYKHYKLYKPNKQNKTRVKERARSSKNGLVKRWAGEKKMGAGLKSKRKSSIVGVRFKIPILTSKYP